MAVNQGDIAFIGINTNGTDWLAFVTLNTIQAGDVIYFTDNELLSANATTFNTGESYTKWTAPAGGVAAGTVIILNSFDTTTVATTGIAASVTFAGSANRGLSATLDVVYAYTAASDTTVNTPVTFLSYINIGAGASANGAATGVDGFAPASLPANLQISFTDGRDGALYQGVRSGQSSLAGYLAFISDTTNWTNPGATATLSSALSTTAFTSLSSGNPVNLSVSANSGSEANQTSITVTATASSAVVGDQTVTLTVTGTGTNVITTGDYTLNNTATNTVTITILSGQTTGTATFKVVDDILPEGDETAILTISSPSAGITLGATTTQNILIIDNDSVAINTAPTILADNETIIDSDRTTPFLGVPSNSPAASPTAFVSGVINDPTDPARTLGIEFNVSDTETAAGSLTVTATSSNTLVVANTGLVVANGINSNSRNLKITPVGIGFADITVTVSDGALTNSYVIKYAASAAGSTSTRFLTGAANASTAIAIDANFMLVGDDENQALRLYDRQNSGLALNSFDFTSSLGLTQLSGGIPREVDIEASARVGNRIFWLGSESNNDSGTSRTNRNRIFGTDVSGTGASTTLAYAGRYDFLRDDIINWDVNNVHGLGANFFGLAASAASGVGSKQPDGYNIEGFEFAPNNTTGYVAFRAPQEPTTNRTLALIVPVVNFTLLLASNGGTQGSATFGAPIQLDLGGRGIREIRKNAANQYVIIAGPAGDATGTAPADFRLYTWTGVATDAPVLRSADLTALNAGGSFESIVGVPDNLTSSSQLQLLVDNGASVFYNDGTLGSDITIPNFQKSRSEFINLGTAPIRIRDIQGASQVSPLRGQTVNAVPGIVTAIRTNGFFLQDPTSDNDDRTSEGIFVFTSTAPTVAVGDAISVSGTVAEFRPGATGLSITQISSPVITTISRNNALPAAIILGNGGRAIPTQVIDNDTVGNIETGTTTFDPAQDGIDFYESLEGMRVQINNAVAVRPTNNFGEIFVLADNGANATGRTINGGIGISPNDFNPERIQIDPALYGGASAAPQVNVGARFNTIVGVVSYNFNNFEVLPTSLTVNNSGTLAPEVTNLVGTATQLTVATFNVENLDPSDGAAKFNGLAAQIVNNLKSPDIINLQEIQDNNGAVNDGTVDASVTLQTLINAIAAAGGPTYQFSQVNPINGTNGGEPGGNIRPAFLYNPSRVTFTGVAGGSASTGITVANVNGVPVLSSNSGLIDPTNTAFASSRKPLVGQFTFNGQNVIIVNNHFNSKGGDQPLYGLNQPPVLSSEVQRNQQATIVKNFVQSILAIDATANVMVVGDLNDFSFSNPLNILKSGGLLDLVSTLPQNEQYDYIFEGNSQDLDHLLSSGNLFNNLAGVDVVRINAEFADQTSDHDPILARFNLNPPPVPNSTWKVGGVKDFDTNGKADILWRNPTTAQNAIWQMSNSNLIGGNYIPSLDASWNVGGLGDFGGDGKNEILWRNNDGTNAIWQLNGTGPINLIGGDYLQSLPSTWKVGGVADFGGDGKADILWRNTVTGQNAIWQLDGKNPISLIGGDYLQSLSTDWTVGGVGDFGGDGKADIFWRNSVTGQNAIWHLGGNMPINLIGGEYFQSLSTDWTVGGVGDFGGDGKSDIFWRNASTGQNAIWELNGSTLVATNFTASLF